MAVIEDREARGLAWPPLIQGLGVHLFTLVLYLVLASWATQFMLESPPVPLLWPATGIGLAMVYRFGYGIGFTLLVAGTISHVGFGAPLMHGIVLASGAAVGACVGAALLRRLEFSSRLERVRDIVTLLLVGAGVSAFISGLTGTLAMVGVSSAFGETMGLCWLADTMGVVLFAPVLLAARWPGRFSLATVRSALLVASAPMLTLLLYGGTLPSTLSLPLSYAVFPLVLFLAFRLPPAAVALATLSSAMVAVACTAIGKGPFAQAADLRPDLIALHVQLALLQLTALLLVAVRHERVEADRRARDHLRTLARIGRMNAVSTMAAGIAHEINQPLCAVNSYANAAMRLVQRGESADALKQPLQRIVDGSQRAAEIIRRTRHFLETGETESRPLQLEALVREAAGLLRPEYQRQRVQLVLELDPAPCVIRGDELELQQVLVNLLQNALEAEQRAGRSGAHRVSVTSSVDAEHGVVALTVRDGGTGIPEAALETLFDPMVTHRQGGNGLGLAIARSIVEAHGGRLTARNHENGGAEFRLTLPLLTFQEIKP
ncbi:MAG: MASE1 domain-containing protein [Ectothiorhodospiraceae bacterium]|nr:MASE1 domain-containing protein [Ectothiorhodospiraceae bacterium]